MSSFLTFSSGPVRMAIALRSIREIVPCDAVTRVPHVPAFVRGVVNLRGHVLPVVDVAMRFGLAGGGGKGCLIVVDHGATDESSAIGFLVDAVENVFDWDDDGIAAPPSFGLPIDADAVSGIALAGDEHVVVLDLGRVVSELERAMAVAT